MRHYPITIHGLFSAPVHQVFGQKQGTLDGTDILSLQQAKLIAHSGILGDRFCHHRPEANGHVTFFSWEVWQEMVRTLDLPKEASPKLTRRNIILSGVDLKALYGKPFSISGIPFVGTEHCAPCLAMNQALGPNARAAMRSRGGLRAQVKGDGLLHLGDATLQAEVEIDPENATCQVPLPPLP